MTDTAHQIFEVSKQDLSKTRIFEIGDTQPLSDGDVRLKVDKFALTANNITYGITGDLLGYWQFFPAEKQWGRLPVMGFADVVESKHDDVSVGERVWGFFPMANSLTISAGKVSNTGFSDVSVHRQGLSPVYSRFERVANNPFYHPSTENYQMLLKGLYTTSWLIDDFMYDNNYFGADQYLITSASSKTSIALAFAIKQRGEKQSVGLTSASRVEFVKSLDLYDHVVSYEDVASLDGKVPTISVDMAGAEKLLTTIHHHFGDNLKFSSRVGATHIGDLYADGQLQGPKPVMFFAPHQLEKRAKDWGSDKAMIAIAESLNSYIDYASQFIEITPYSFDQLNDCYMQVLTGRADASKGIVVNL